MEREGFTEQLRSTLFRQMTGREGEVSGRAGADADVRGMLAAAYGPGARGAEVNTRAAAEDLGVSQRTVQRWIASSSRQHNRPRADHLRGLATRSRQAATTRAGRRRSLAATRASAVTRDSTITLRGKQGVIDGGKDYRRFRQIILTLDPTKMNALLDAYESRGDRGLIGWIEEYADEKYAAGWSIENLERFELGR